MFPTAINSDLDYDADGLPDIAEFVLGTRTSVSDSDQDGVLDGDEVRNGTNPLDGRSAVTGVIATAPTPGTAVDVCVSNDRAITAEREAGVSIFNIFNAMEPVLVGRVDTPGSATAVACSGNLLAVADGEAGLQIIDLTSPATAGIVRRLDLVHEGFAQTVAMLDRFAFVGTRAGVFKMVEADTGVVRQSLQYDGAVDDIVTHGGRVFVLANSVLHSFSIEHGFLEPLHSVTVTRQPADRFAVNRRRITAGNDHAYIANYLGYDVVDMARPEDLRLVGSARILGPNAFKFIADNGNGLGIAAVGVNPRDDGTHNIHLFDLSDPTQTDRFLTVLPTPGIAHAAALHNGLAYVADGAQGLQVVNYLAYDNKRLAPTGTLELQGPRLEPKVVVEIPLINASFESNTFTVFPGYVQDNAVITGWTAGAGAGVNPGTFGGPFTDNGAIPDGQRAAFIQANTTLSQAVRGLQTDRLYRLTYRENARICCSGQRAWLEVRVGGQVIVEAHSVAPVSGSAPYRLVESSLFTADNTEMTVEFIKTAPEGGDNSVLIDDVRLHEVTLPTSLPITAGALLVMQANVRDDVQVRNVEFLADGALLGTDGGSPFELAWRPPANLIGRTIELSARVTDTGGNSTNLPPRRVSIVADTLPPLVQLEAPPEALQRNVGDMLRFDLRAGDNVELSEVRFLVNGQPVPGYRSEPGYAEVPVPSGPGAHLLQVIATDRSGNTTTRALSFRVKLEAISREFSLFNFGPSSTAKPEAISREFSLFNFGPSSAEKPEAISREFSIENRKPAATTSTLRMGEALPATSKLK